MLDYRIETLLAVIEQGTLLKASEKLGLTQPAVSQHLKALEEQYGIPLFEHVGRKLVLNDAGRMVQQAAERTRQISRSLERELKHLLGGKKQYTMGATLTIGEFILPAYLGEYRQKNPHLELTIRIENTKEILSLLDRGEIDLALVEGPFPPDKYKSELFLMDEMIFIGSHGFLPPENRSIGLKELQRARLILREPGSGTRFYWEEYLRSHKINLPDSSVIMEVGSLSAIKSLVEAGFGCSVMSSRAVKKERLLGSLKTRPFSTGPLIREMHFVYTDDSPLPFIFDFRDFVYASPSL